MAEQCEMCAAPLAGEQRHLLDLAHHTFLSICTACALAFGPRGANAGLYRLIPTRRLALLDFQATDELWAGPVTMICLLRNSETGSVLAVYLDPSGVRESVFDLDCWKTLRTANPLLESLEPDVEALLLQRVGPAPASYIVPIDTCARLIGLLKNRQRNQVSRHLWNAATLPLLRSYRMLMVLWTVDTNDYRLFGSGAIVRSALSGAKPGAIILLHDGGGNRSETVAALPTIIAKLRARGFRLVTVPRLLLDNPPPRNQQVASLIGHGG